MCPAQLFNRLVPVDIPQPDKLQGALSTGVHAGPAQKAARTVEDGLDVALPAAGRRLPGLFFRIGQSDLLPVS